jgi:Ca2+-binding RTX toxin-like protein
MAILRSYSATFELPIFGTSAVTRWRFNEDPGSTTALDSVDALDGSYLPGAAPGDPGSIGDGAARFDGETGRVVVADAPDGTTTVAAFGDSLVTNNEFEDAVIRAAPAALTSDALQLANGSVELWFTPDSIAETQVLFSKNAGGPNVGDIEILVDEAITIGMQDDATTFNVTGGSVVEGEAAHVVFTFGAEGMNLFVDGDLVGQDTFTGGLVGNVENLVFGARANGSAAFDGVIDEVAIYGRALTAAEIQRLFDAGERGSTLIGSAESDRLIGGSDDEDLRGLAGDDQMNGKGGDDALRGAGGGDGLLGGPGDDDLFGGAGADDLSGGPGDDLLEGGGGADTLSGNGGADDLFGGRGIDVLRGGAGDDLLNGGPGPDRLIGSSGSDTLQIDRIGDGVDEVRGFAPGPGGDVLDLSAVLDFSDADAPNDFVRLTETDNNTSVDVNADGAGDDFTAVFNLLGVIGLNVDTLVADGNVQLEPPPAS